MSDTDDELHYIRNEYGGIHAVDQEHYERHITVETARGRVLIPGWEEVDEATARDENPQLFGGLDPNVRLNYKEMQDADARENFLAKHRAGAADDSSATPPADKNK